jgi:magnesium-transporting ATPase (P-type)
MQASSVQRLFNGLFPVQCLYQVIFSLPPSPPITGKETKLVMNSRATPSKLSNIKRTMNKLIYVIFAVQVFFCVFSLVASTTTCSPISATTWAAATTACSPPAASRRRRTTATWATSSPSSSSTTTSLYVTVKICNYLQAYFIDCDVQLYIFR